MDERQRLEYNLLRRMNIGDLPKRTAARCPDKVALVYKDLRITFRELNENCCRMAHVFESLGARKGDRITFMTHNCLQYIYSWLGACKLGCVSTPSTSCSSPTRSNTLSTTRNPGSSSWRTSWCPRSRRRRPT